MNIIYSRLKYLILWVLNKNPLWWDDALEIFQDEYVPGLGVYASDGVYFNLFTWATLRGYRPMWEYDPHG